MKPSKIITFLSLIAIAFVGTQCSVNHHQKDYIDRALNPPTGIQAMTSNGEHKSGTESDPTDWQTAPEFGGLFEVVTPAYPNPVAYNSLFKIIINVKGFGAINGLYVYAFRQPGNIAFSSPIKIIQRTLTPGIHTIRISPQKFAQSSSSGNFGNVYRIIL